MLRTEMIALGLLFGLTSYAFAQEGDEPTATTTSSKYVPTAPYDYYGCAIDPGTDGVKMIDMDTGGPLIHLNGAAVIQSSLADDIGYFLPTAPPNDTSGSGASDLSYTDSSGTYLLAIYDNGDVGYVSNSSNGQTFVPEDDSTSRTYITSVWILDCDGVFTPILANGDEYIFQYDTARNVFQAATSSSLTRKRQNQFGDRQVKWIGSHRGGSSSNPHSGDEDEPRCDQGEHSRVADNAPANTPNGCGAANGFHPPSLTADISPCCNDHDICYGDCTSTWKDCNSQFLSCMNSKCDSSYGDDMLDRVKKGWCYDVSSVFYNAVSSGFGRSAFDSATSERCQCDCDPDDKFCNCFKNGPPPNQNCSPGNCCGINKDSPECECCIVLC